MEQAAAVIIDVIKARINMINTCWGTLKLDAYKEKRAQWMSELHGMLTCLRNINFDIKNEVYFYAVNELEDRIEFGYYTEDGTWNIL